MQKTITIGVNELKMYLVTFFFPEMIDQDVKLIEQEVDFEIDDDLFQGVSIREIFLDMDHFFDFIEDKVMSLFTQYANYTQRQIEYVIGRNGLERIEFY